MQFESISTYPSLARASALLRSSGMRIAVAESCTGGLLGATLTSVSGSSAYVLGGVISYDDALKKAILSVPAEIITQHGAVSEQCARAMARGIVNLAGADIGVSITGISGPLGGTPQKPVGTTYIGIVAPGVELVRHFVWGGDRAENRASSVEAALQIVVEYLESRREPASPALEVEEEIRTG